MDEKKNENEKVMKYINSKLKEGQIPLMLVDTTLFSKSSIQQAKMVITSSTLYYIQNMTIKRYIKVDLIQFIALTPYCNQMIIFFDPKGDQSSKDMVRAQSLSNVRIIQDIISVREKFCEIKVPLPILISGSKNLESVANSVQSANKGKFFGLFGKKKQGINDLQNRLSVEGDILYVYQKDFALQIGQRMYNLIYKNVKLLYMNSSETFRFYEQKYISQQINPAKKLFRCKNTEQPQNKKQIIKIKKTQPNKNVLMRKIGKQSAEQNKKIANDLMKYKNEEYKQEILFAIQTETHFQILTTFYEQERDCQSLLISHQSLDEKDLRSIFFKLIEMIQSSQQIFYSLSPQNIIMGKEGVRISKIFSCLKRYQQADYIAPEELFKDHFSQQQIQWINLWKIGILIFQLAYGNVPFPIQYIISKFRSEKREIQLELPRLLVRSLQFQTFIKSLLRLEPQERGLPIKSQKSQLKLNESIINHTESILNNENKKQNWKTCLKNCKWVKNLQNIN